MPHTHDHCLHRASMAYCSTCDVAYCRDCGQSWGAHVWTYRYPSSTSAGTTFTVTPFMQQGSISTHPIDACNHNEV